MSPAWGRDFRPLNATNRVFPYRRKDIIDPMRVTPILHVAVIAAAVLTLPTAARGASAKDVFTKVAPSVVVVLALDEGGKTMGQGSGVVVGEYEVVTNCHVLGKAADVAVRQAADWSVRETYRMAASLLARNDERDLCLLFVDELPEPPAAQAAQLGAAKVLSVGEEVYAVGAPAGLELSLSRGIVSQLRGAFGKRSAPLVQTDAAISPGSSGGGLFNQAGELVGLTTFKWRGESLNFALPAEWIEELRAQGRSKLMEAKWRVECPKNPTYECVIELALGTASGPELDSSGSRIDPGPAYRCGRLLDIAATQTRVGDTRGAKKTLSAAFEAARESRIFKRSNLAKIVAAQTRTGDEQAAKQTLAALRGAVRDETSDPSAVSRNWALREYSVALAKTGNTAKAIEIANRIIFYQGHRLSDGRDHLLHRSRALGDIAEAQAEAGDVANAMKTAMSIDDHWRDGYHYRNVALAGIASMQAKAGDFAGAMRTEEMMVDASMKHCGEVLFLIAAWQLAGSHVEAAEHTLSSVSNRCIGAARTDSDSTTMLLCIIQAKKGNFAAAIAIADSFDDPSSPGIRVALLGEIAVIQVTAGDAQGAKRTLEAAREAALGADKAQWRAMTLSDVAAAQAKAGNPEGAAQAFAEALEINRMVDSDLFLQASRAYIAERQAEAGFFSDAVKTAFHITGLHIDDMRIRIEALMSVAYHLSGRPLLPWWDPRKHL